jgi:pyruvate formate lyase activating enzyme
VKKTILYEKLKNKNVRCQVCQRRCVIAPGKTGFCLTRLNRNGKLYCLNYGIIQALQVDPIEKKPFYHFKPGSMVPSIGSFGCNFRCKQCLNWSSSWGEPATTILNNLQKGQKRPTVTPKELIAKIEKSDYQGLAFTYNEPTIWVEYVLDVAKLAKDKGFFTLFVTNGSWTKETLDKIGPFIDAANIDFKGFTQETYARQGAFFGEVMKMAEYAQKKHRIFLEITTLLIPGINDNPQELSKMAKWIVTHLGKKTPLHFSQYDPVLAPDPEFKKLAFTSRKTLDMTYEIAKKAGLEFVYIWAPSAGKFGGLYSKSDLICPKCKTLVIKRSGWKPEILAIDKKGRCSKCGENLNVII